jgi:energy-coupling factor transporter ATP-binding protein EcfA2
VKARENPFESERIIATIRYTCAAGSIATLIERLAALRYRAAIVGPHGAGKTTLLEDLARALEERGFRITLLRLAAEDRRLPDSWPASAGELGARDIVCLDGAEQLSRGAWLSFRWRARHAAGLIVTSHRRGRLPLLVQCTTSPDLLDRIVRRLSPAVPPDVPASVELVPAASREHPRRAARALRRLRGAVSGIDTARDRAPYVGTTLPDRPRFALRQRVRCVSLSTFIITISNRGPS